MDSIENGQGPKTPKQLEADKEAIAKALAREEVERDQMLAGAQGSKLKQSMDMTPAEERAFNEKSQKDQAKQDKDHEQLKKAMMKIGLNSKGYPSRPGEPACIFWLKTGECRFVASCKWDHPETVDLNSKGYPLRSGQPPCPHYLRTQVCKFGSTCKFDHPEHTMGVQAQAVAGINLNSQGLPVRPDQAMCDYYLKTGRCKFGAVCRWHHPEQPASSASLVQAVQQQQAQAVAQAQAQAAQFPPNPPG